MGFNLAQAIEDDQPVTPVDNLTRAIQMGELMVQADSEVTRLTDELKAAKEHFNSIAMVDLPALLQELGLSSIELDTGAKIAVRSDLSAAITAAKHDLAMKWLIDNGFGGLIKTNVTVAFSAEEQEAAAEFAEAVMSDYDNVDYKAAVHPGTLKAFVKEQLAAGFPLPLDLFSVHEFSIAKLTQAKK